MVVPMSAAEASLIMRFLGAAGSSENSPNVFDGSRLRMAKFSLRHISFITRLSDDILVDHVILKMDVEDVVTLRMVSKLFYHLTHQPIIWKRFLRLMNIVPPPLPPAKRYGHLASLSGFEAERMVIRAISFHNNWRSERPKVYDIHRFPLQHNILSMTVLPGAKHLVVSVADHTYTVYSLMVFVVDHRHGGLVPLAKTPTVTKAYNLRAKYMTIKGMSGIVIGYVRREFNDSSRMHTGRINPSDYADAGDIDPPLPLRYECTCFMVSLDALEDLTDPNCPPGSEEFLERAATQPPPFLRLSRIRSRSQLDAIDLASDVRGEPYIAIVKKPETIIFKNLNSGITSSLTIKRWGGFENVEHNIHNFRIMPYHGDMLVMISIPIVTAIEQFLRDSLPSLAQVHGPRKKERLLYACIFAIPTDGDDVQGIEPFEMRHLEDGTYFDSIQISDPVLPVRLDPSIRPMSLQASDPPVCIYYRNLDTLELIEVRLRPCRPDPLQPLRNTFFESLRHIWKNNYQVSTCPDEAIIANVLPGHCRPLIWTTLQSDRTHAPPLVNFHSHIQDVGGEEKEWDIEEEEIDMPVDQDLEDNDVLTPICITQKSSRGTNWANIEVPAALRNTLKFGIKALAWDDWTGRIFAATLNDCMIHVIDLAQGPKENSRGQRIPVPLAGG